jgi:SAM-dependent methyltransferase
MLAEAPVALDFQRYLEAKRTVDDRSLNARVWQLFATTMSSPAIGSRPQVLEVGAGIGTMLERLVENGVLGVGSYTGLDADAANTRCAGERLARWASGSGAVVQGEGGPEQRVLGPGLDLRASFLTGEALSFASEQAGRCAWDAILAHAFLDLVDLDRALPALARLLRPRGLFYATLNFDGETIFQPEVDRTLEAPILAAYHRTMDERLAGGLASGEARTGRRLFGKLSAAGFELLEAGASDWVVFARDGRYPGDEQYFLRTILGMIGHSVEGRSDVVPERLERWMNLRLGQLDRGELVYIAHQMDFLARKP